jgi:hypothetical protein
MAGAAAAYIASDNARGEEERIGTVDSMNKDRVKPTWE